MEIYVVRSGDTVYAIARRYGVTAEAIIFANQLAQPDVLSIGQALVIPLERDVHIVRQGDTLYSIARKYGTSVAALLEANPQITDPNRIQVGQRLRLVPSGGEIVVNGYVTDVTVATLRETLPSLTFLSVFSYQAGADGSLTPVYSVDLSLSAAYRTQNLMSVTNLKPEGGFSSEIAHALFTDAAARERLFANILATLRAEGFAGVNLDFEYVLQTDRQNYNTFLRALTDLLHENGYLIITALAPKLSDSQEGLLYSAHDYAFHGKTVDFTVIMTYEWGYTYGPPMAVAPLNMVRRVLNYAVSVIPPEKILMGIPNYGYDWTLPYAPGTAARPLTNVGAVTLAGRVGAEIEFDQTAQAPFFRYTGQNGSRHEVWFEDARSLQAKMRLAEQYKLGGVSFWNLNSLFRTNFLALQSVFTVGKNG